MMPISRDKNSEPAPTVLPSGWEEVTRGLRWRKPIFGGYASVALDLDAPQTAPAYLLYVYGIGGLLLRQCRPSLVAVIALAEAQPEVQLAHEMRKAPGYVVEITRQKLAVGA